MSAHVQLILKQMFTHPRLRCLILLDAWERVVSTSGTQTKADALMKGGPGKMSMFKVLAERRSFWIAFISTTLITIAFPVATSFLQIPLVDAISDPTEVRQVISDMTPGQRFVHAWITATLDVAYPLAYGALFIGSAYAFYERFGRYIAYSLLVVVPTDLLEGVVQILALMGFADFLAAKAVLTPLKTILFLMGAATTLFGWLIWTVGRTQDR